MKLVNADCLDWLPLASPVKCIFADPPDNIGLAYSGGDSTYVDSKPKEFYYNWLESLINEALYKCDVFWFSYNQIHDLEVMYIVRQLLRRYRSSWSFKKIIWTYTFGQYNKHDFTSGFRPIIRLAKSDCIFYPDAVKEESERMRLGDARAAGMRVPNDVWDIPRVVGNSYERQSWHPTQHPVLLYKRIVDFSCCATDVFVDLFAGSGTCFRVGRDHVIGVEVDSDYCSKLRELYFGGKES